MLNDPALQYLTVNGTQVELLRHDVSKGIAAIALLNQSDRRDPRSALAFGDGYTDLSVARNGIPLVLLGNAPLEVKQAAEKINIDARAKGLNDLVAIVDLEVKDEAVAKITRALFLSDEKAHSPLGRIPPSIIQLF